MPLLSLPRARREPAPGKSATKPITTHVRAGLRVLDDEQAALLDAEHVHLDHVEGVRAPLDCGAGGAGGAAVAAVAAAGTACEVRGVVVC